MGSGRQEKAHGRGCRRAARGRLWAMFGRTRDQPVARTSAGTWRTSLARRRHPLSRSFEFDAPVNSRDSGQRGKPHGRGCCRVAAWRRQSLFSFGVGTSVTFYSNLRRLCGLLPRDRSYLSWRCRLAPAPAPRPYPAVTTTAAAAAAAAASKAEASASAASVESTASMPTTAASMPTTAAMATAATMATATGKF
jgi:hypothetical protein